MYFYRSLFCVLLLNLSGLAVQAQNQGPLTPEQKEKQLMEAVDKEVSKLSGMLKLEYWQEFFVDSTLTHDYRALTDELEALQKAKVENSDLYQQVQDKWMDRIDKSYKRFFTPEQWQKYLKSGAGRAQKARDKRKK